MAAKRVTTDAKYSAAVAAVAALVILDCAVGLRAERGLAREFMRKGTKGRTDRRTDGRERERERVRERLKEGD